jgi:DNA repair exonuclease SbcCD ATPase subunit
MSRTTQFGHVLAWVLTIVMIISSLPSAVQRELEASLQRLEVPAVTPDMVAMNGRSAALLFAVGTVLMLALERIRATVGGGMQVQVPRAQPVVNGRDAQQEASRLEAELASTTRNRDLYRSFVRRYARLIVKTVVFKKRTEKDVEHVQQRIAELEETAVDDKRRIRTLQTKFATNRDLLLQQHKKNRNGLLGTINVLMQKNVEVEKELADVKLRYETLHSGSRESQIKLAMASRELNVYAQEQAERIRDLEARLASLEDEQIGLHEQILHLHEQAKDLIRNAKNARNQLNRSRGREASLASAALAMYSPRTNAMTARPVRAPLRRSSTM